MSDNWESAEAAIGPHLSPGERLLRAERPASVSWQRKRGRRTALFGILFMALSLGLLALFAMRQGQAFLFTRQDGSTSPAGFLLLLAGLGLFFAVLPFVTAGLHRKSVYAVTAARALELRQGLFGRTLVEHRFHDMDEPTIESAPDGTGHLWLREEETYGKWGRKLRVKRGFTGLADPQATLSVVRSARARILGEE